MWSMPAPNSRIASGISRSDFAPSGKPRQGTRQTNGMASNRTSASGHNVAARSSATKLGKYRPRTFSNAPPGSRMLCRGPGSVCKHRHVPEDDLHKLRRVAHQLDEAERDVAHQPVGRQPHDADQQAEQRGRDDAHRRDQQRVQHAHQQGACIGVADGPRYQTKRDVEIRRVGEEAEAQRAMPSCRSPGGY